MRTKLYYVVEIELESDITGDRVTTGNKTVTAYKIVKDDLYEFATIECEDGDSSIDEINNWLEDNGYNIDYFELKQI